MRRNASARQGQSLVELAVLLPVLTMLMVGSVDVARLFYLNVTVANSSRVGAEYAMNYNLPTQFRTQCRTELGGSATESALTTCSRTKASAAVRTRAVREAGFASLTAATTDGYTATFNGNWNSAAEYTVQVTGTFWPITPLAGTIIGANPLQLVHTTKLRHTCKPGVSCTYECDADKSNVFKSLGL